MTNIKLEPTSRDAVLSISEYSNLKKKSTNCQNQNIQWSMLQKKKKENKNNLTTS